MNLTENSNLYDKNYIINILKSSKCVNLFKEQKINSVMVFGSIVSNDFCEYSDVDIAILSKEKNSLNNIMDLEETLEKLLNREIDIIDLSNEELDLRFKVSVYDTAMIIYNDELDLYAKDYDKTDRIYKNNEEFRYFRERDVIYDE